MLSVKLAYGGSFSILSSFNPESKPQPVAKINKKRSKLFDIFMSAKLTDFIQGASDKILTIKMTCRNTFVRFKNLN